MITGNALLFVGENVMDRITSRKELEDTRGEDYITCLICGKDFTILGLTHLRRIHSMDHKKYRILYNIPNNFPLCSKEYSRRVAERVEEAGYLIRPDGLAPGLKALGPKGGRRPNVDYVRAEQAERCRLRLEALGPEWRREHARRTSKGRPRYKGRFTTKGKEDAQR